MGTLDSIFSDVENLKDRVGALETGLRENTVLTNQVLSNTRDLVEAFQAAQGAFKTIEVLAKILKPFLWLFALPASIVTGWNLLKSMLPNITGWLK